MPIFPTNINNNIQISKNSSSSSDRKHQSVNSLEKVWKRLPHFQENVAKKPKNIYRKRRRNLTMNLKAIRKINRRWYISSIAIEMTAKIYTPIHRCVDNWDLIIMFNKKIFFCLDFHRKNKKVGKFMRCDGLERIFQNRIESGSPKLWWLKLVLRHFVIVSFFQGVTTSNKLSIDHLPASNPDS